MESYIYLAIIILLVLGFFVLLFRNVKLSKQLATSNNSKNVDLRSKEMAHFYLEKESQITNNQIITDLKISHKDEINELKENHRSALKLEFEEGYKKGLEISKIEVKVTPIARAKSEGTFISKKELLEIGFSYRLFSNGIPCLAPHEEIVESIYRKEINEENVNMIAAKIETALSKIPNSNLILTESISSFTKKLILKK